MEKDIRNDWDINEIYKEDWPQNTTIEQGCLTTETVLSDAVYHLAEFLKAFNPERALAKRLNSLEGEIAQIHDELGSLKQIIKDKEQKLINPKEALSKDEIRQRVDELKRRKLDFSLITDDDLKGII